MKEVNKPQDFQQVMTDTSLIEASLHNYNATSRKDDLIHTISVQLYQLFELLDTALKDNLKEVNVSYKGSLRGNDFKAVKLPELVDMAVRDVEQNGDIDFGMHLSIYCYREIPGDVEIWSTKMTLLYEIHPQHEINRIDDNFPYIEIEKERLKLGASYTILQKRRILNGIMFRLIKDYDLNYSEHM